MYHTIAVLGSTGSIGRQTLEVAEHLGLRVAALAAYSNIELLEEQIRRFTPDVAAVMDEKAALTLKRRLGGFGTRIEAGIEGVSLAAAQTGSDIVLSAVTGMAGLIPTLRAIEAGKDIALANKETLVAGGELVTRAARERGVRILPVDSEHSAIFQCLQGAPESAVKKIILTASGGPFFGKTAEDLRHVTREDALKHPNWVMGAKITIDSATMMNKGLEIIEAVHLFGVLPEKIEVVVHRESIIHSMVEFDDGAVLAQMGLPDMRLPIQYALTFPARMPSPAAGPDFGKIPSLTFAPPDEETFVCLKAAKTAIARGGLYPAALNAANEQAVGLFLENKIPFAKIGRLCMAVLENPQPSGRFSLPELFETDRLAREWVLENIDSAY